MEDIFNPDLVRKYKPWQFSKVITKRVLINIPTWEGQQQAIVKICDILEEGGMYIMMDATLQGYEKISRMRERCGIERTKIRWHNLYLDEDKLVPFLKERFDIERISNFSSTYYVGSRVLQAVLLKWFHKEPSYDFFLNHVFAPIPSFGDCGIQKMFILKKKSRIEKPRKNGNLRGTQKFFELQDPDNGNGFQDGMNGGHFRVALIAVMKNDGDFVDRKAHFFTHVIDLDLKGVSV